LASKKYPALYPADSVVTYEILLSIYKHHFHQTFPTCFLTDFWFYIPYSSPPHLLLQILYMIPIWLFPH
ncbi:hypothetical protein ACQRBL_32795, partial [Bacillus sp. AF62]|uniref:hypothetical protein n=1 Tax=Bacillus sp. AF62 TaxID=3158960 RepID=UPI003CFDCF04